MELFDLSPQQEVAQFTPDVAVEKEKSLLERFTGKAAQYARVFSLTTAMAVAGLAAEARADEAPAPEKAKQPSAETAPKV